jgi:hypothetical protein
MPLQQAVAEAWKVAEESRVVRVGKQRVGNMDPVAGFPPPLYTHVMPGRPYARCLVSAPPPPPAHAT